MFTGMWDPCRLPPFPSHFQAFGTTWTRCTSAGMYIAHILSTKNNNLHINVLLASLLELLIYVRNFFFLAFNRRGWFLVLHCYVASM